MRQKQVSHQSNGFVGAMHGHIQNSHDATRHKLRRTLHTAFSNFTCHFISSSLRWISALKIHSATRRQNPFQYLLGSPYVSPLCMFGASVSALITDHKVRAAKLTNRWISGSWWDEMHRRMNTWWRRSMVCSSADQFAENLRERSGADVKRSRLEGRNGIFMWKWTLEYLDRLSLHVQMKGCRQRRHSTSTCTSARRSRARNASTRSAPRKHSGSEHFRQISVDLLDALGEVTPLVNADRVKMPGTRAAEQHHRRKRNVESLQIQTHDRWTRVVVRWIPSRRRKKQPLRQTTRTRLTR